MTGKENDDRLVKYLQILVLFYMIKLKADKGIDSGEIDMRISMPLLWDLSI